MNYKNIYNSLILKGQSLHTIREVQRLDDACFENHHIIPRCMGGSNDFLNLVYLTPEEHFLAHQLLIKIYPKVYSLYLSVQIMIGSGKYAKNNKSYGRIKRSIKENKKTLGMPLETRIKISVSRKGMKFSDETKKKMSESRIGKTWEELMGIEKAQQFRVERTRPRGPLSKETKDNISTSKKGIAPHVWTDEMKLKTSMTTTGVKKPESQRVKLKEYNSIERICPHCDKKGSGPSMQRWHFNNCKNNAKN